MFKQWFKDNIFNSILNSLRNMFLASIGRRCLSLSFFIFIGLLSMFGTRKWFSVLMSFLNYLYAYLTEYDHNDIWLKAALYPCISICFIMSHYQNIAVHCKCRLIQDDILIRVKPASSFESHNPIWQNTKASLSTQLKISL